MDNAHANNRGSGWLSVPDEQPTCRQNIVCWWNHTSSNRSGAGAPVRFLHVPKTGGTSLANLLFVAQCGAIPVRVAISPSALLPIARLHCPRAFDGFGALGCSPSHMPLLPSFARRCAAGAARCFTMQRRPWERMRSGFYHGLHSCGWMQQAICRLPARDSATCARRPVARRSSCGRVIHPSHDCLRQDVTPAQRAWFWANFTEAHVRLYGACVGACSARMLTGLQCGRCSPPEIRLRALQLARAESAVWPSRACEVGRGDAACDRRHLTRAASKCIDGIV